MLVVPTTVVAGWEFVVDDRVVVVEEVHEHRVVVRYTGGSTESIEIARQDTDENAVELEGSEYEVEIEEEADVEDDAR